MIEEIERLNRILDEVARLDGIKGLKLNHEGTAALEFKGGVRLLFEYVADQGKLFLYSPLFYLPANLAQRTRLYEAMLACNFLKLNTGKGEFAVSLDTEQVIYQVGLDASTLNTNQLDDAISGLLKQREECLYQLERRQPAGKSPGALPASSTVELIAGALMR